MPKVKNIENKVKKIEGFSIDIIFPGFKAV